MKKRLLASLLITSVNPPLLYAQTDLAQTPADLPEMVVTATRSEVPIDQLSSASIELFSKVEISSCPPITKSES